MMQNLRIPYLALPALLLVSCIRLDPSHTIDRPCGVPIPGRSDVLILVMDDATVDPADERKHVGRNQKVVWRLKNPASTRRLEVEFEPVSPPRFVKTRETDWETRAKRRPGDPKRPCEEVSYKLTVYESGVPVPGDPILIIRE